MGGTSSDQPREEAQVAPVAAPTPTPPESDSAALPNLPNITLAPKPLSRGPYAAIYRGWDRVHRCDVIVKVQRATGDLIAAERFRREAAVMQRLRHPNIVALYQFHDGDPAALILEYVPGRTLADLVEADGWLTPLRTAQIIEGIAAALDCAHAQGIIHRDVKPSNILLPRRSPARLFDFGVAHIDEDAPLTVMGDILGTIEYASPEQVHGNETPDARSDVYSLSAVAYFALTGTPPFRAADASTQAQLSVMHRQVFADPPSLRFHREDLSPVIEAAVLRGLAKAPASRYPSAGQFAAALRAAVEDGIDVPEQRAMAAASRRTGALAGALAGATLLLLGVLALWRTGQFIAPHPAQQVAQAAKPPKPLLANATPPKLITPVAPKSVAPKPAVIRPVTPKTAAPLPVVVAVRPTPLPLPVRIPSVAGIQMHALKPTTTFKPVPKVAVATQIRPLSVMTVIPLPVSAHPKPLSKSKLTPLMAGAIRPKIAPKIAPKAVAKTMAKTAPKTAPKRAWLYLYAKQNIAPLGPKEHMAGINAQSVWVDGYHASDLTSGHWTSLPAGRHVVSFIPDPKSGFAPRKDVVVMLTPGAHVRKQILLPVLTGASLAAALPHSSQPSKPSGITPVPHPSGWYMVSGWVPANASGHKSSLVRASAQWVKVDGQPVLALALGRWALFPAGKHVVTFQPTAALGIGPKTWNIDLKPQARLSQQIPFSAPMLSARLVPQPVGQVSVSGWLPVTLPGQKTQLVPVAAEWIKIDGRPSADLAHGLWVSLPAGKHIIMFQPVPGSGAEPATRVISLSPQAHLNQLVPLTPAPLPATPLHLRNP